jgi:hypothetical protein
MQFYIYAEDLDAGVFSPRRAEHEFHVMFSSGVRVNEMSQHIALAAYPNPTSGLLVFPKAFENNTLIEVFDLQGARVMSFMTSKGQCTIDMNSLPNGIYVLSCNNNHQRIHLIH